MKKLYYLPFIILILTGCGDADTRYVNTITNNTEYEIIMKISIDSIINLSPFKEQIIEDFYRGFTDDLNCEIPDFLANDNAIEFIIANENKVLTKDIYNQINWNCSGKEDFSLITVGDYFTEIKNNFQINEEDIIPLESAPSSAQNNLP